MKGIYWNAGYLNWIWLLSSPSPCIFFHWSSLKSYNWFSVYKNNKLESTGHISDTFVISMISVNLNCGHWLPWNYSMLSNSYVAYMDIMIFARSMGCWIWDFVWWTFPWHLLAVRIDLFEIYAVLYVISVFSAYVYNMFLMNVISCFGFILSYWQRATKFQVIYQYLCICVSVCVRVHA